MAGDLSMSIVLGAALAGTFTGAFNDAGGVIEKLNSKISSLSDKQKQLEKFDKMSTAFGKIAEKFNAAADNAEKLGNKIQKAEEYTEELKNRFAAARDETNALSEKFDAAGARTA